MSDTAHIRALIADLRGKISEDRRDTYVNLQAVKQRARDEERRLHIEHHQRIAPIEREIEALVSTIIDVELAKPVSIVIPSA